jgi:hypothetical protein
MSRHWRDKAEQFSRDYPFAIPTPDMDPNVVDAWLTINKQARLEEERERLAAEVVRQLRGGDAAQTEPARSRGGRPAKLPDDIELMRRALAGTDGNERAAVLSVAQTIAAQDCLNGKRQGTRRAKAALLALAEQSGRKRR